MPANEGTSIGFTCDIIERIEEIMAIIGIFDSGVGGLSLVEACERQMPGSRILYVADTAHQPYGRKTAQQVLEYSERLSDFLLTQGAQAILVACSTASATAVPILSKSLSIPILGLLNDGWVQEAHRRTRNGRIGILATPLTVRSESFAQALRRNAPACLEIMAQAAPDLIDAISEGKVGRAALAPLFQRELKPLLEKGIDTLIIGCTHFNFILEELAAYAGPGVALVNPRDWAVQPLMSLAPEQSPYGNDFYVTQDRDKFQALARRLWRADANFKPLEWSRMQTVQAR